MKKILAFVAIAAASAALFAADSTTKGFKLKTTVDPVAATFELYDGAKIADNAEYHVVLTDESKAKFDGVFVRFAADANFGAKTTFKVTASDTGFYVSGGNSTDVKVETTVKVGGAAGATGHDSQEFVGYVTKETKLKDSDIVVTWTANPQLAAASYQDDVTVTIAVNN